MRMRPELIAEVDFSKAVEAFPALALFAPLAGHTAARLISGLVMQGYSPHAIQRIVDTDAFIISLAGSVFCQMTGDEKFGHDNREG
jgi:hypothetical protein